MAEYNTEQFERDLLPSTKSLAKDTESTNLKFGGSHLLRDFFNTEMSKCALWATIRFELKK